MAAFYQFLGDMLTNKTRAAGDQDRAHIFLNNNLSKVKCNTISLFSHVNVVRKKLESGWLK